MNSLAWVFGIKIAFTATVWCLPILLLPPGALNWLGFKVSAPMIFLRLLGAAYAALLVGYVLAFIDVHHEVYPAAAVWVGIASNAGAFLILLVGAATRVWNQWGPFARLLMGMSLVATGFITAGLIVFGPMKH